MPPVCKFYLKGSCRFGSNCRFEHPGEFSDTEEYSAPQANKVTGFSFKGALSGTTTTQTSTDIKQLGGFSFTRALEASKNPNRASDVDMSDGDIAYFNRPFGYNSIFKPATPYQQHQQSINILSQTSFQQQVQHPQQFLQPQQINNPLFGPVIPKPASSFGSSPFLSNSSQLGGSFHQESKFTQESKVEVDKRFSNIQDLKPEELRAFESDKFELRKIPIRPPPAALCQQ